MPKIQTIQIFVILFSKKYVDAIKSNKSVMLPGYDFFNHTRIPNHTAFDPNNYDVIIIEGIMLYNHAELQSIIKTKIFVHTDLDVCLARRILRDLGERGRDVNSVINQWFKFVKPGYEEYIYPTMIHADYIFNNTKESIEENIHNDHKLLKIIEILLSH